MDRNRLFVLLGIAVAFLGLLIFGATQLTRPSYQVLYGQLEPAEAGRVVSALEQMGVQTQVADGGQTVLVPSGRVAATRMALASQGLPSAGGPGYELFDDTGSLGMTSFEQTIQRQRALEGELARTIESLEIVSAARVQLVLPEREAFSRDIAQPSATVVVDLEETASLDRNSGRAIQNVVAAAVPRLEPGRVTLTDTNLEAIFTEQDGQNAVAQAADELRSQIELDLENKIKNLLHPLFGRDNIRVTTSADVNLNREVRREQRFDPNEQVVRSTQTIEETETSSEPAGANAVTVQQNLPEAEVQTGGQGLASSQLEREEETVNYEISNSLRETVSEPGAINRLSVSVLVNGTYDTIESGDDVFVPRSQEQLDQIRNLVQAAVGFQPGRGDLVVVETQEFVEDDIRDIAPLGPTGVTKVISDNFMNILGGVFILLLAAMLLVFGLRPILDRLLPPPLSDGDEASEQELIDALGQPALPGQEDAMPGVMPALSGAPGAMAAGAPGGPQIVPRAPVDETLDQMIELRAVEGKVRASSLLKLSRIVDDNPDEVVAILRSWIYEDAA